MKILTLNTHSLQEENYLQKLEWFVEHILREMPDLIALQEVNQTADAEVIATDLLNGWFDIGNSKKIRRDNHAAQVADRLQRFGVDCSWAWLPIKLGYGKYDEGVAVLSLNRKIRRSDYFPISETDDYGNWRTRAALGVQLEGMDDWFYTVHMGWWDDEKEPFRNQWKRMEQYLEVKKNCRPIWLLGDFNASDLVRGESYDTIAAHGWQDTYSMASVRDDGITVAGIIDGWREKLTGADVKGMRLDYIWTNREREIISSRVVFNGSKEPVVSDHFGVLIEVKETMK